MTYPFEFNYSSWNKRIQYWYEVCKSKQSCIILKTNLLTSYKNLNGYGKEILE